MKQDLHKITASVFFLIGCVLLYFLIQRVGFDELVLSFNRIRWNILYILGLPLLWYVAHTGAWYYILEETGSHISFFQLLKIKLSGESINTLTPVSWMGGDPVRIYLLQKKMPTTLSAASTVLDRTMHTMATVILLFIGMSTAWFVLDLPKAWRFLFPLLTMALACGIYFLIHHQKKGLFDVLSRILARLGIKRHLTESIQNSIQTMDERISRFYKENPQRFLLVLGLHFIARLLGVLEIFLISFFLTIPLGLLGAFFLASLSILVNMVFVFIPGSMGVMEGAYGALFLLMGLNPVWGVAIQIIRRLRTIFWIFIGLLFMLVYTRSVEKKGDRKRGPSRI